MWWKMAAFPKIKYEIKLNIIQKMKRRWMSLPRLSLPLSGQYPPIPSTLSQEGARNASLHPWRDGPLPLYISLDDFKRISSCVTVTEVNI